MPRSAYVESLNRSIIEEAAAEPPPKPDLKQQFLNWFESQPEISRRRPYAMVELESALDTPGRLLGPVLMSLGWTRHRQWKGPGPFLRFWLPPDDL